MSKKLLLPLLFLMLLIGGFAAAGLSGPRNYEDCVLDKMKGQQPTMLAFARDACRDKFPYSDKEIADSVRNPAVHPNLADIREKNPTYADLSDYQLLESLAANNQTSVESMAAAIGYLGYKPPKK